MKLPNWRAMRKRPYGGVARPVAVGPLDRPEQEMAADPVRQCERACHNMYSHDAVALTQCLQNCR